MAPPEPSHPRRSNASTACIYFARGVCRNGDACSYLHDPVANGNGGGEMSNRRAVQRGNRSMSVCSFFARGACRFGAACKFSHEAGVISPAGIISREADGETSVAEQKPPSNKQLKLEAVKKARREAKQRERSGAGAREHAEALATPFTIVSHGWDRLTVDAIKAVVTYTNDRKTRTCASLLLPPRSLRLPCLLGRKFL